MWNQWFLCFNCELGVPWDLASANWWSSWSYWNIIWWLGVIEFHWLQQRSQMHSFNSKNIYQEARYSTLIWFLKELLEWSLQVIIKFQEQWCFYILLFIPWVKRDKLFIVRWLCPKEMIFCCLSFMELILDLKIWKLLESLRCRHQLYYFMGSPRRFECNNKSRWFQG